MDDGISWRPGDNDEKVTVQLLMCIARSLESLEQFELRDILAGFAIGGMLAAPVYSPMEQPEGLAAAARCAYLYADALLAARGGEPE